MRKWKPAATLCCRVCWKLEGMSIRAITRMTGASKNTVAKLMVDAGQACVEYQDKVLRNLACKQLQLDEIWSFVYAKAKNAPETMKALGEAGDIWTRTAIDANTNLIASWIVGDRTAETGKIFVTDLASRLTGRAQVTSDGHRAYVEVWKPRLAKVLTTRCSKRFTLFRSRHGSGTACPYA
jgi:hypothetical protein